MAWSYRSDRADEVYAKTSGPAAAVTEQMPRPPIDGEDVDNVLNPPVAEAKKGEKKGEPVASVDPEAPKPPTLTEAEQAEQFRRDKAAALGQPDQPAPAPTAEEQQKAIDEARGSSEKKETKAEHTAAAKQK
jgi:hypothetical protein